MALQAFFRESLRFPIESEAATVAAIAGAAVVVLPLLAWFLLRDRSKPLPDGVREPVEPPALPFLGHSLDILKYKDDRHNWFTSLGEKYGGRPVLFRIIGRVPLSIVFTPEHAEDVLKTHFDQFPKGHVQRETFRDVLGHGIFGVDGMQWVHQRKTASNLFTTRALRDTMTESMRRYAVVLQGILQKAVDNHTTIDVFKLLNAFTIEAFAKMGFGINMHCLDNDGDHPFQHAFDSAQRVMMGRFQRPQWFWKLQRLLSLGNEGQLKKDVAVINDTVMKIITESLAHRHRTGGQANSGKESADIVSLFLDRFDGSNGEAFDPVYLRDIVVNFLIAGRDTTAQAMSWCFYNLSQHPQVVAKIREELARVVPEFASGHDPQPPTMEQVQQLVYLDAVLKETLRLHPSVPAIPKAAAEDVVLSDGTFLRKGTVVLISVYGMARMKFIWGDDAKEFKPERWIDETGKIRNVSAYQFVSFNAGPRMCLGMNLAMLEMKIVMASVLSRFNIELLAPESITYDNSVTLPVRGEMLARVTAAPSSQ